MSSLRATVFQKPSSARFGCGGSVGCVCATLVFADHPEEGASAEVGPAGSQHLVELKRATEELRVTRFEGLS